MKMNNLRKNIVDKLRPIGLAAWVGMILLMGMILLSGCTKSYDGSWLLTSNDRKALKEYKKFKADQEAATAKVDKQRHIQTQNVNFGGPQGHSARTLAQSEVTRKSDVRTTLQVIQPAVNSKSRDRNFLYGQLHGRTNTFASSMDGSANLRQVSYATDGADFDPSLDRTGKWIVYASTQHRQTSDLYVKSVNGTAMRQLTDDPANDATPTFSPDGKWVAFASDRAGNWDIYLISVDGGVARQITNSPNDEIHPSFSPDSKKLVFSMIGSRSQQWEMVVTELEKPSAPRFIGNGLFPQWSPVDDRIVYQRAKERGSKLFQIWRIQYKDGEGLRPTQIASSSNAAAITPSWSPDGKAIVFCTIVNPEMDMQQGTPVKSDIWLVNADGSGRVNLTNSRFANLQPNWSPDGTIYFVSNRGHDSVENLWAVSTESAMRVVNTTAVDVEDTQQTAEVSVPIQ